MLNDSVEATALTTSKGAGPLSERILGVPHDSTSQNLEEAWLQTVPGCLQGLGRAAFFRGSHDIFAGGLWKLLALSLAWTQGFSPQNFVHQMLRSAASRSVAATLQPETQNIPSSKRTPHFARKLQRVLVHRPPSSDTGF